MNARAKIFRHRISEPILSTRTEKSVLSCFKYIICIRLMLFIYVFFRPVVFLASHAVYVIVHFLVLLRLFWGCRAFGKCYLFSASLSLSLSLLFRSYFCQSLSFHFTKFFYFFFVAMRCLHTLFPYV